MLLPSAERRGEIHFYVAKFLPYGVRLGLAFGLLVAGLAVETVLIESRFWLGLPLVLAGVVILLTKGYQNRPAPKPGSEEWRPAQSTEVRRILELDKQQKGWDRDAVDITCARGFLLLLLMSVGAGLAAAAAARWAPVAMPMVVANSAVVLLPFWVTGVRSILKTDQLVVKAKVLLFVERTHEALPTNEGEEFQYQIQTADVRDGSGQIPRDVKAILAFHNAPAEFLGVQMQVSINNVQGKDYPYFYCVLVARREFNLLGRFGHVALPRKVVIEPQQERDVDIIVIRQETTKNSGYYTRPETVRRLAAYAIGQARRILGE